MPDAAGGRGPLAWLVAALAAVAVVGVVVHALLAGPESSPGPGVAPEPDASAEAADGSVTELRVPSADAGRCALPDADLLATRPLAVDATVQSITDGTVTLVPRRWYAGQETDLVTVDAPPSRMGLLLTSVPFEEGERYLVAADEDGTVMLCGFSAAWTPGLASLYAEAFPG